MAEATMIALAIGLLALMASLGMVVMSAFNARRARKSSESALKSTADLYALSEKLAKSLSMDPRDLHDDPSASSLRPINYRALADNWFHYLADEGPGAAALAIEPRSDGSLSDHAFPRPLVWQYNRFQFLDRYNFVHEFDDSDIKCSHRVVVGENSSRTCAAEDSLVALQSAYVEEIARLRYSKAHVGWGELNSRGKYARAIVKAAKSTAQDHSPRQLLV